MSIQKKEVEYAKEVDDVMVLVLELLKDIKEKKPVATLALENLQNLMNAMNGLDQVDEEVKANKAVVLATVGGRMGEIAGVFV